MTQAKKVAITMALITTLSGCVSGCASNEQSIKEKTVNEVVTANEQIFDEQQEEIKRLKEKNKELNDLAYTNGERVKWLQKAYDELLAKYNALKPKENLNESVNSAKGVAHRFQCTWYSGGQSTAIGTRARDGVIAVDPRIIPLRSKVYVEVPAAPEYNGWYIAEDTGGGIKGNIIDIFTSSHIPSVGRTTCIVYY